MIARIRLGRWSLPLGALGLFLLVVAGRAVHIGFYGESVPFWDEWDAEGAALFRPWLEGTLSIGRFFEPQNEHRLAFTRLLSFVLFLANDGQWDNLVEAYASACIYGLVAAFIYTQLASGLASVWGRLGLFVVIVLMGWLPFGWENTLVGFQSQSYLMTGFAVATIAVAAAGRDSLGTLAWVAFLAVLGLFTMASGMLAAVVAGAVLLLRFRQASLRPAHAWVGVGVLGLIAVTAAAMVPTVEGHRGLRSSSIGEWFAAFWTCASWPLPGSAWSLLALWLPTAWFLPRLVGLEKVSRAELFAGGASLWVLLQCAAIAYSRGQDMVVVSGRYRDTFSLGLIVNLWLALKNVELNRGRATALYVRGGVLVVFLAAACTGLWNQIPTDLAAMRERGRDSALQTERVRAFVADGDPSHLQAPRLHIPYPDPIRLASLLTIPALRSVLPASVRAPLSMIGGQTVGAFHRDAGSSPYETTSCTPPLCSEGIGTWKSRQVSSRFSFIEVPVQTRGKSDALLLGVVGSSDPIDWNTVPTVVATASRVRVFGVPKAPFRLAAADLTPQGWMAVGSPVEVGILSMLARRLQAWTRQHAYAKAGEATVELPFLERDNLPLPVTPDHAILGKFRVTRAGVLSSLSVFIGTYGGASDGDLAVELCASSHCVRGRSKLTGTSDNSYVSLRLSDPIVLNANDVVTFRFFSEGATHAVALWTYPAATGSAQLSQDDGRAGASHEAALRTIRMSLSYLD